MNENDLEWKLSLIKMFLKALEEAQNPPTEDQKNWRRERLRDMLVPLIWLTELYYPGEGQRHRFSNTRVINLNEALDMERLEYERTPYGFKGKGTYEWEISQSFFLDRRFSMLPVTSRVTFREGPNGKARTRSIKSLHTEWLPTLNDRTMSSTDLLDQILVWYTIKRAQNGDKGASESLFALYQRRAEARSTYQEVLSMVSANLNASDDRVAELLPYDDEFKSIANAWLRLIVGYLTPLRIMKELVDAEEKPHFSVPPEVFDILLTYYTSYVAPILRQYLALLNSMGRYLANPTSGEALKRLIDSFQDLAASIGGESWKSVPTTPWAAQDTLLNEGQLRAVPTLLAIVQTSIVMAFPMFIATALSPYTPLTESLQVLKETDGGSRVKKVLGCYYRPTKMGPRANLTLFLFGSEARQKAPTKKRGAYPPGRLLTVLRDSFASEIRPILNTKLSDFSQESQDDDGEEGTTRGDYEVTTALYEDSEERSTKEAARLTDRVDLESLFRVAQVSNEDQTFLLDAQDLSDNELAEKYQLTVRQTRYRRDKLIKAIQKAAKRT